MPLYPRAVFRRRLGGKITPLPAVPLDDRPQGGWPVESPAEAETGFFFGISREQAVNFPPKSGGPLKKGILVLTVLLVGLVGLLYLYVKTRVAGPVEGAGEAVQPLPEAEEAGEMLRDYEREFRRHSRIVLQEEDVSRLIMASVRRSLPPREAELIRSVRTEIRPEGVQIAVGINLRAVPRQDLPAEWHNILMVYEKMFGQQALENVPLILQGKPRVVNRRLEFFDDARLEVAGISVPLRLWLRRLGNASDLEKQLQTALPIRHIELHEGYVVLTK